MAVSITGHHQLRTNTDERSVISVLYRSRIPRVCRVRTLNASCNAAKVPNHELPPGKLGLPLVGESIEFLADPVKFVRKRLDRYGPVFKTNLFGKPTVFLGGAFPVQEFMAVEGTQITASSYPDTFTNLHTKYGALNQEGERLRSTRLAYSKVLGPEAIKTYLPTMEKYTSDFLDEVVRRGSLTLTPDLEALCIQMYAKMFLGISIPDDIQRDFRLYNDGLVALSALDVPFTAYGQGSAALMRLQMFMESHINRITKNGTLHTDPAYFCIRELASCVDETGEVWTTERVGTAIVLLVWGAYSEAASLVANVLYKLPSGSQTITKRMREEISSLLPEGPSSAVDFGVANRMQYLEAVFSESLRLNPPAGGGMRLLDQNWTMSVTAGGYTIPEGWVVSADPRISNFSYNIFPEPDEFVPERFATKGCPFGFSKREDGDKLAADYSVRDEEGRLPTGVWIPGGIGSHQCPGIPLAMTSAKVIMTRFLQRIETWEPMESREPIWKVLPIRAIDDDFRITVVPFKQKVRNDSN